MENNNEQRNEQRFYAMAQTVPDGEIYTSTHWVVIGGISAPTLENVVERFFDADNGGDADWFASGLYQTKKLGVRISEKNEHGIWTEVNFREWRIEGLRGIADKPGNYHDKKRPTKAERTRRMCVKFFRLLNDQPLRFDCSGYGLSVN